jgi:hypothetical protein
MFETAPHVAEGDLDPARHVLAGLGESAIERAGIHGPRVV